MLTLTFLPPSLARRAAMAALYGTCLSPIKPDRTKRAGGNFTLPRRASNAVEESGRWPMGLGSEGTMGQRPATGRAKAAGSGRPSAARPGAPPADHAGWLFLRHRHHADRAAHRRVLAAVGLLPRAVRRTGRRAALRHACPSRGSGPAL